MRNIGDDPHSKEMLGDDAHFQEDAKELSKNQSQRHGLCSCKSSNSWHHEIVT
jgi:hypothetical protein